MRDSTHYFGAAERQYEGLDLLSTAVLVLDARACIVYANQSAELLLDASRRNLQGQPASRVLGEPGEIERLARDAAANLFSQRRTTISLRLALREPVLVQLTATSQFEEATPLILELSEIEQRLRQDREERQLGLSEASRELLRNLAHEIKNPLGGIRGAAQLLDAELRSDEEREYTRVIIAEADRLHTLVDRLLAPHRMPHEVGDVNIHEVCERVRALLLAEFPRGLTIVRDYDASVPDFRGDREQLIQALLNIVRNAAEALEARIAAGDAQITLRTRVARQATIARTFHRLALDLHVIDNGPGIPEDIRDRIFFPLVSGREGGSGLGLALAQTFVHQHQGAIEVDSRPGRTAFRILIPLP
ncbi:MAG TPA: nitrogen regulation protein NR(II) [Burkholderiaceae bacterium]|nr:nitrogen regulation protein NR(II) [Burkholderiaceae bacterium]HPE02170.1 nitrogen regulation protein NR(II) [Burkholderiaceae bacterium]HRZ01513.1 nitrogen regulation protein NR(II) [Burkholderiaceae bacterium]